MSKKLEIARKIIGCRFITNQYNKVFSLIRNSVQDEYPDIYPTILKDIKKEEEWVKDEVANIYSNKFTIKELLQIHSNIQTKQGRSIFKKTIELCNLSTKIGEEFLNRINSLIDDNRRTIIIGDKKCKMNGRDIPSIPRRL